MQADKITNQAQADAASRGLFHTLMVGLIETVKDTLLVRIGNADARVRDLYFQHLRFTFYMFQHNGHTPSVGSIFESVRKQVHHYLAYLVRIKSHRKMFHAGKERELYMFLVRHQKERIAYLTYIRNDIVLRQGKLVSAHLSLAEVKQLVDQHQQTLRVPVHQYQHRPSRFVLLLCQQLFQRSDNQGQRSAEFVTYIGKETELHLIDFLVLRRFLLHLTDMELLPLPPQQMPTGKQQCQHKNQDITYVRPP